MSEENIDRIIDTYRARKEIELRQPRQDDVEIAEAEAKIKEQLHMLGVEV